MQALATARVKQDRQVEATGVFTESEAADLFEQTARFYLAMSGAEFLRKWDANEFSDPTVKSRAMRVAALIPLVRTISARKKSR
jgi:hypothetical protein